MSFGQLKQDGAYDCDLENKLIEWDEHNYCTPEKLMEDDRHEFFNVVKVEETEQPIFDKNVYKCERDGAEMIDNIWHFKWKLVPLIDTEIMQQLNWAKEAKNVEITEARTAANDVSFPFGGKHISTSLTSKLDILFMNGEILNHGGFPPKWVGGWKALDNLFVPIATLDDWKAFYSACVDQGLSNFKYSEQLKGKVLAATTLEAIDAIAW